VIVIKGLELPKCPYCGEKLLYLESFLTKNKSTYECKCCECFSEVVIKSRAFKFFGLLEIFSFIIFVAAVLLGGSFCLYGLFLVLFVFTLFYFFSPFSVRLYKVKGGRVSKQKSKKDSDYGENIGKEREIYSN